MPRRSLEPVEWAKSARRTNSERRERFLQLLADEAEQSARRRGSLTVADSDVDAAWHSIVSAGVRPPGWMIVTADAGFVAAGAMTSAAVALVFLEGGGPKVAAGLLLVGAVLVGVIAGAMKYGPRE